MPNFAFPIYKPNTLSCHRMKAQKQGNKNTNFVEANVINISAKFQLYHL